MVVVGRVKGEVVVVAARALIYRWGGGELEVVGEIECWPPGTGPMVNSRCNEVISASNEAVSASNGVASASNEADSGSDGAVSASGVYSCVSFILAILLMACSSAR